MPLQLRLWSAQARVAVWTPIHRAAATALDHALGDLIALRESMAEVR